MAWGIILTNLGTPSAPTKAAYRKFLKEFLSDPRVVEIPPLVWWPILNGIVLPFRPSKVAAGYQDVWIKGQGSPLAVITRQQVDALSEELQRRLVGDAPRVTFSMTYGEPKLAQRVAELQREGVDKFFVLPLYPQYSATTTAPVYDQFARMIKNARDIPELYINKSYYAREDYRSALAQSIREFRSEHGAADKLLLSFHGIPKRCVDLGDPYLDHCRDTAHEVAKRLGLNESDWRMSFQSRLGRTEWLQPYTVDVLREWAAAGVKTVDVACPAFAADCLETLEEIAIEGRDIFREAGGEELRTVPCLNSHPAHISMLANIVEEAITPRLSD